MARFILTFLCGTFLVTTLTACLEGDPVQEGDTIIDVLPRAPHDPSTYVCNPFGGENSPREYEQGIKGTLYYLEPDQPQYSQVSDYIEFGTEVTEIDLFINKLNVPTRPFDRGFETLSGQTIQTLEGDTLYEWFAIRTHGLLKLADGQAPGYYQLSILSDDGAILRLDDGNGNYVTHIDNDGTHPTRMGCTGDSIYLDENTEIPFELDYYQGPRYHISMILLIRPFPSDPADVMDPECGRQGNGRYFDSNQDPPEPQSAYNDMLARGWAPVDASGYKLPTADDGETNPCNEPEPVVISELDISEVTSTTATLVWQTDLFSTSQIRYTNLLTGEVITTDVDMNMVTNHSMTLDGLSPNTVYTAVAISASASGLTTESNEVSFRTRR